MSDKTRPYHNVNGDSERKCFVITQLSQIFTKRFYLPLTNRGLGSVVKTMLDSKY